MVMGELTEGADVVVVGGGPGGYAAALRAADLRRDVTLVTDEERLGGVCLLRGCIPSKALLHLAEVGASAAALRDAGVTYGDPDIDPDAIREWIAEVVEPLTTGLDSLMEARGIRVVQGRGRLDAAGAVRVEDGEVDRLEAEAVILATGSRPVPFPDVEFGGPVWDSARALEIPRIPDDLLVVGGGYVGLELGTVYAFLGSRVTLVEMEDRLMPRAPAALVETLSTRLGEVFEEVRTGTRVEALEVGDQEVRARTAGSAGEGGETGGNSLHRSFDAVLVALGRTPRSGDLGLDEAGVEVDGDGFVRVDEARRTTAEGVFAVGDLTGGMLLAHEAMHEGRVAAGVAAGEPEAFDARAVPAVVYTDPQVAWCGLTEDEARERGVEVEVARFPWKASGRARTLGRPEGVTRLVVDPDDGRVLGVGVTGPGAEALVAEGALAVEMGATVRDLGSVVHPHPTLSETLGEAAEAAMGLPLHLAPGS